MRRSFPAAALSTLALAALLLAPAAASAADGGSDRRAFEIADLYRTAFVSGPAVSPDGSRVAFAVRRYDLEAGETWSEIWTVAPDGSALRQMTFSRPGERHGDTAPVFSPDGRTLAFVSDRSGTGQVWVMAVDGGEPRRLTDFPPGVADPVYSPDGRWLAVTAEVYPECGADAGCNEGIATDTEGGKLSVHVADELLYRHWTAWRDGRYSHVLLADAATGEVVRDLTPGRWDSPTFSLSGARPYDFAPDSRHLVYVSNHDPRPAESTNADLWRVPVEPAAADPAAVNLTAGNGGWDGAPLHSPDGRWIAYLSQERPGDEADLVRLALLEVATGTVRYLTDRDGFDDWVDEMDWLPDSSGLVFQAEVDGRTPLYRIAAAGGEPEPVLPAATLDGWQLTPDGGAVVYTARQVGHPTELYRAPLPMAPGRGAGRRGGGGGGGGEPTLLTRFNAELADEVDIRPAEEMWVAGDGDYEVQVFVVKPHGFDPAKKYPLILNVHGGPQQQWTDGYRGDWQVYPGRGYAVAFANPTGSPGRGQDFVDAIGCDWGGRVYRDLMKVTDALAELPWVDGERMGAMGWSYGGYMTMWFAGHTERFAALASMMGVYDLPSMYGATEELWFVEKDQCGVPWEQAEAYRTWSPSTYVAGFKTPTLVVTGEIDYRVPYTQSLQFFTALQKRGVPSRLVVFPGSGHWPGWHDMVFYYTAHLDWFHRWLGGEPPPWSLEELARNRVFGKDGEEKGVEEAEGEDGAAAKDPEPETSIIPNPPSPDRPEAPPPGG